MSEDLTRREWIALVGAAATAASTPLRTFAVPRVPVPFPLAAVRLLPGPFLDAQDRDRQYLMLLQPDRLLHNFRVNAGLEPRAPVYGGWESEEPWVGIRCHGHTLGHYLSAASLMYASTGDDRLKQRVDYIVGELRACQDASRTGLVCAFPDGPAQLDNAIAGRRVIGVPWYTMHKVLAGLRDAHLHANSGPALEVFARLAAWATAATAAMSDELLQRMLGVEHGGMNEALADAAALTGEPKYFSAAQRFCHEAVLAPLAASRDPLDGLHANTQIPKVVGFQRLFELTGNERYGRAARFFWQSVVGRRSFVTGGHGDNEHFFPPSDFARHLASAKTMETCGTHNMLRLTRALFGGDPAARLFDFYERALYNGILASQDPASGMMTYFQGTRPGYVRLFHTPERSFWCCTGTGIENHAKYGDSIYFRAADTLWVNLFIPSVVDWADMGLTLRQETAFPDGESSTLTVTAPRRVRATLNVRCPAWCDGVRVRVNGRAWNRRPGADGYVAIAREWRSGDRIDVQLPMTQRTEALPGNPDVIAFLRGPIVLAGRLGTDGLSPGSQIIVNERESGSMLNAAVRLPDLHGPEPPRDIELAPYYRLAHERYNLYWKVTP